MPTSARGNKAGGFTLIELLLVVALIAIASGVASLALRDPAAARLEQEAVRLGATQIVLETGIRQTVAIALYARCGYMPIPLYGEYSGSPGTSVCLGRKLR